MANFRQVFRVGCFLKSNYRLASTIPKDVVEANETSPDLSCNYTVKEKLINLGLPNESALKIAAKPEFASVKENKLDLPFEILWKCQFGSGLLTKLIESHPLILLVDGKTLETTCINLLSEFKKTYAYEILLQSPEVLNENWDSVCDKLKYLREEMGVSNLDIVRHGALRHPLDFIKIRHEFLSRTGKYKKLNPKVKPRERHLINPTIGNVLNSSTEYFCKRIAEVSEFEFQVFQQLYYDSEDSS